MVGVPPHQRHPQVPLFTQTRMPKYDLFSEPHFLIVVTFQEMTIKHLIGVCLRSSTSPAWPVPTERTVAEGRSIYNYYEYDLIQV